MSSAPVKDLKETEAGIGVFPPAKPEVSIFQRLLFTFVLPVIVALGIGWLSWAPLGPQTYENAGQGTQEVWLKDGSRLDLSPSTVVVVEMKNSVRALEVESGEVLFDVARDALRPFEVRVGGVTLQARGTIFSVRKAGAERIEATVREGRVVVLRDGAPDDDLPLLHAGDRIVMTPERTRIHALPGRALQFDGMPVQKALRHFNVFNDDELRLVNASDASLPLEGRFRVADIDAFIKILHAMDIRVVWRHGDAPENP